MIVKNLKKKHHYENLDDVLNLVRSFNKRLNHAKWSFGIQASKFPGYAN